MNMPKAFVAALMVLAAVLGSADGFTTQTRLVAQPRREAATTLVMRKGRPSTRVKKPKTAGADSAPKFDWVEVATSEKAEALPQGEGEIKAADIRGNTYAVVRRADSWFAVDVSCGKCKFPMLSAKLVEDADGDDATLVCGLCGSTYRASDGALVGQERKSGLVGMFGNIMAQNNGKDIASYELRTAPNGKVYINFGPLP